MKNRSNSNLYERLISGDKDTLGDIYLAYKKEFFFYFKKYKINDETLLDLYQDCIIIVYQKFINDGFRLKNSSLKTYVFGIGKNKIYNHFKKNQSDLLDENSLLDVEKDFEVEEPNAYSRLLSDKLKEMSSGCKQVLELFYYRSLSIKEIVQATDYKDENTVKSHKSRCLKRLKELCKAS